MGLRMADLSRHQKKIVDRYYENRDAIMLGKLQELITELYLAESDKKRENLWKRVAQAMTNLKAPQAIQAHILEKKSPEVLAQNVEDWLKQGAGKPAPAGPVKKPYQSSP